MKIAIIVGSIREGRAGSAVGQWVKERAATRDDADYELLELADFNVPLLTDPVVPGAANRQYADAHVRAWGQAIDSYDGFVFVTPEYNHGVPAGLKNAFDSIYPEWSDKAVAFVGYGADGGVRSVEQWRQIVANAHLHAVRGQVSLSLFTDFGADGFEASERRDTEVDGVLDQLVRLTGAMEKLRSEG